MRRSRLVLLMVSLVCAAPACSAPDRETSASQAGDTLTRAGRDSAIARSRIPNAKAVGRAQDAAQSSQQRTSTLDSMQSALDSLPQ